MLQDSHVLLTFDKIHNPLPLPRETTSERPKMLRTLQFFACLTSKCASRHNGVHFFDISTSKSALNPSVFYTFDFEMCFAPQPRAIFHLSSGQLAPQFSTLRSHKSLEKHNPTFSRTWIFFLLRLFFSDPCARKGRKVAKHCVFPMICGSGGSKSRLAMAM